MAEKTDMGSSLGKLEDTFNEWFVTKAPFQLPKGLKEFIVAVAPWVTLVVMVLTLPLVLFALGLGAIVAPFAFLGGPAYGVTYGFNYTLSMIVLAVVVVLELLALPGLFKRSIKAWRLVYWAMLVSFISSLVSFNIISGIISAVIGLYFLFQVREYYK